MWVVEHWSDVEGGQVPGAGGGRQGRFQARAAEGKVKPGEKEGARGEEVEIAPSHGRFRFFLSVPGSWFSVLVLPDS